MAMDVKAMEKIRRTLEAFAYIASSNPRKSNMYNVLKVFYLADKMHMERYGRFIFDEEYAALDKGPVPSKAYNLLKELRDKKQLSCGLTAPVSLNGHSVIVERKFDARLFSGSDLKCIDEVIKLSQTKDLGEISHDQAWNKSRKEGYHIMPENFILDALKDSALLKELVSNRY